MNKPLREVLADAVIAAASIAILFTAGTMYSELEYAETAQRVVEYSTTR